MDALLKNFGAERIHALSKENAEPDWLKEFRLRSLELFRNLPIETSELFKTYTNLNGVNWDDFDFHDSANSNIPDEFRFLLSDDSIVCCNDQIINTAKNNGIIFLDIKSAIGQYPDICKEYFTNKILKPEECKFVAFNNAFFNSGFFLYVPGNKDAGTLRLINIFNPENSLSVNQNIIIVGENSKITLIEEEYSKSSKQALLSSVTDIHVKEGAQITLGNIQSLDKNAISLVNKKALLERDAKIFCSSGFFGGLLTLSYLDNLLKGNGSAAEDFEIAFGDNNQRFNISSNLFHEGIGTTGKVMTKGVFDDRSKGLFRGMININKQAKNSTSYLSGHSILLNKDAGSDAIPGLQIENNDVKATHSASVAQINEEQIFYLMSRGFSESEARKSIVSGFLEPIIKQIPLREVAFVIRGLFEIKWNNQDITKLKDAINRISEEETEGTVSKSVFEGHYKYR